MVKGGNSEITHKEYCTFVMMKHTIMSNIYYGGGEMANSSNAGSQHMILHKNKKRKKKKKHTENHPNADRHSKEIL